MSNPFTSSTKQLGEANKQATKRKKKRKAREKQMEKKMKKITSPKPKSWQKSEAPSQSEPLLNELLTFHSFVDQIVQNASNHGLWA